MAPCTMQGPQRITPMTHRAPCGLRRSARGRRNMSTTTVDKPATSKKLPMPMNGVDTPKLFATIAAVADQRSLAQFRFRAEGEWIAGTHMRSTMSGYFGAGGEMQRK